MTENDPTLTNQNPPDIPEEIAEVIKELPEEKGEVIRQAFHIQRYYSGALPDGENIKIYNEVIPNGGDRLMKTVERQLKHRITLEQISIKRTFNQALIGQWMGFAIAIIFGLISYDLAKAGKEVTASILGTIDLVALVAIFITKQKTK